MRDIEIQPPFVKRMEVQEGDTVVLASGEEWLIPPGMLVVYVEESTQIAETGGPRRTPVKFEQLRIAAKKNRDRSWE